MRTVVPLLLVAGCLYGHRPPSIRDQADSVYKLKAEMTVDAREPGAETADPRKVRWSATAWVADRGHGISHLVTAGHACESGATYTEVGFLGDRTEYPILSVDYSLIARDGTVVKGLTVDLDDDTVDLCMLSYAGDLGTPLPVADRDPEYGSMSTIIGAPRGLWGGGTAPVTDIKFSGRGTPFGGGCGPDMNGLCERDGLAFVGHLAGGQSGSPILHDGRVVAVFNLGNRAYGFGTGVPWDVLRRFSDRALHRPG